MWHSLGLGRLGKQFWSIFKRLFKSNGGGPDLTPASSKQDHLTLLCPANGHPQLWVCHQLWKFHLGKGRGGRGVLSREELFCSESGTSESLLTTLAQSLPRPWRVLYL